MYTLVTGATGFIGKHTVDALLARGVEVACLVRSRSKTNSNKNVRLLEGDLTDAPSLERALENAQAVIHLASLLKVPWKPEFRTVNIGGTEALASAAANKTTPPTLIVVSSLAAAGPTNKDKPKTERDPAEPISLYGKMKLDCERAAAKYFTKIPITIIRPPMVFGEHDRYGFELFRTVARGIHFLPTRKFHHVSLVHAADLAEALCNSIERGTRLKSELQDDQGLYYVAADERPSYAQLGLMVAQACGTKPPRILRFPELLSRGVAAISEVAARLRDTPTIMNLDKWREATAGSWICDASRAKSELGFAPCPIGQRLAQTAAWYREQGWLPAHRLLTPSSP
jgi:nucleoside-diphosphate-sugar epimerase